MRKTKIAALRFMNYTFFECFLHCKAWMAKRKAHKNKYCTTYSTRRLFKKGIFV